MTCTPAPNEIIQGQVEVSVGLVSPTKILSAKQGPIEQFVTWKRTPVTNNRLRIEADPSADLKMKSAVSGEYPYQMTCSYGQPTN